MTDGLAEIGIVNFPGAQLAAVLGMTDLLATAGQLAGRTEKGQAGSLLRISHWEWKSGEASPVRVFDTVADTVGSPDVLVLPPGLGAPVTREDAAPFAGWLRERHACGTALGSVCKGAFLLGETGLLSGRTVTTHWTYEEEFQARFPETRVDVDRLLIDDGDILTAGGVMAWTDMALRLVDRFLGAAVMLDTARAFLIDPPGREQSYYSAFSPRLNHGDAPILRVQLWLQETGARSLALQALVERSGLEERTFLRRFQKATGLATTEYVQRLRVGRSRTLLQEGTLTGDQVAWEVGYTDPGAFRKVFAKIVGLTPAEYRKRFRT
ncbi:AraC family transcriptional regulator [Methylobacterium sp. Leaf469]|uniref:GlxA family transcriptional regulator n=1 Tax=Methylobacterium sp. Leaf469 TaxID=1736387 RepID=UPI0006F7C05E|nr:GlxA family transcriptional regulator [Methylobacterium sp. Leaf469]KQT93359.1 AraC family transcriptional regulator [Methylobacterium sp. Leaf469]